MNMQLAGRVGMCFLSGIVVGLIHDGWGVLNDLYEPLVYLMSGLVFSAGVLSPYVRRDKWVALRALGLVLASTLSYYVAVTLVSEGVGADYHDWISFTIASVAGAALVIGPVVFLAPVRPSTKLFALVLVSALIGGPVTWLTLPFTEDHLPLVALGYMGWHALIGLALYFGTEGARLSGTLR